MKRSSFIKSLVGLFAAPAVVKDIDWKPEPTGNLGIIHAIKSQQPVYYEGGKLNHFIFDELGQYQEVDPRFKALYKKIKKGEVKVDFLKWQTTRGCKLTEPISPDVDITDSQKAWDDDTKRVWEQQFKNDKNKK